MPVEIRQRTAQFSAVEIAGVHKGFPTRAALVLTLAEQPQQSGRIAVEDCVVQPQIEFVQLIAARVKLHHSPVADDQTAFKGAEVDQGDPLGVGVRMAFGGQVRLGIAVTAARNPGEVQTDRPTPVRADRVEGGKNGPDHPSAELINPGHDPAGLVDIVVTEAARAILQPQRHAPLLVAPGAGSRNRRECPRIFPVEQPDFGGFTGKRQPFALPDFECKVIPLGAVPRAAVVVTEEIVPVVRRKFRPVELHDTLFSF